MHGHHPHDHRAYGETLAATDHYSRRIRSVQAKPHGAVRWLWIVGVVTIIATVGAFLIRQEPNPVDYAIDALLLGSLGLLAFAAASRALNLGMRHGETVTYMEEVEENYRSLRQVFCSALDLRDHVTGGHSERVAALAVGLARYLRLPSHRMPQLEWAAFLHDVGKVQISDGILSKPGPLDDGEWQEMRLHPFFSYSILAQVPSLREAAEIVYCHHERVDGRGYPRGLASQEIPLEARIFTVVDAYDAMTSDRPYRPALPHQTALRELQNHAGTQFDRHVVSAFVAWTGDNGASVAAIEVPRSAEQ